MEWVHKDHKVSSPVKRVSAQTHTYLPVCVQPYKCPEPERKSGRQGDSVNTLFLWLWDCFLLPVAILHKLGWATFMWVLCSWGIPEGCAEKARVPWAEGARGKSTWRGDGVKKGMGGGRRGFENEMKKKTPNKTKQEEITHSSSCWVNTATRREEGERGGTKWDCATNNIVRLCYIMSRYLDYCIKWT